MSLPVEKALRKAQSHIKAGELAEAEELYKQVLSKFPKNKKAIQGYRKLKVGITSKGSSSSDSAQEQFQELLSLYNNGRFEDVLSKVGPLVSLFPKEIFLHNIRGASNASMKRYDAAIESYRKAIKIKPDDADAYANLGDALREKGELHEAIASCEKAIKLRPNLFGAYNNLGMALKDKGELDAAINCHEQAIKIKPDNVEGYYNIGKALLAQGELEAAINSYTQALEIKPDYAAAWSDIFVSVQASKLKNAHLQDSFFSLTEAKTSDHLQVAKSILKYRLDLGSVSAEKSLKHAINMLSTAGNIVIKNPNFKNGGFQEKLLYSESLIIRLLH